MHTPRLRRTGVSFGLLLAVVLCWSHASYFFLDALFNQRSKGLWVSILRQDAKEVNRASLQDKIVFRVDAQNRWYLNTRQVSPAELPSALTNLLARRPDWEVYFEADRTVDHKDAVSAMNAIHTLNAKIVLLTPRMKPGWRHDP